MKIKAIHVPGISSSHAEERQEKKELKKEQKRQIRRRESGTILSEVAQHVKESLRGDELQNVVLDEEQERQRRLAESGNAYDPGDLEMDMNDKNEALANVRAAEEEERARRVAELHANEVDAGVRREMDTAMSVLQEETERTRRMSEPNDSLEGKGHKEAELVREMITQKAQETKIQEKEVLDSQANLIGTVIDEINERRDRLASGDSDRKVNAHIVSGMVRDHLQASDQAEELNAMKRQANIVGVVADELEEAVRRTSVPVQQHDIEHAHKEAGLIKNDPRIKDMAATL